MSIGHYLGIDLGAESGRVMLGTLGDGILSLRELHRFPNGPIRVGDTLRWDVQRIWEEIKAGLRIAAGTGLPFDSVSVDSWAIDYVLMRDGEPVLRQPYCYRDPRTELVYEKLRAEIGDATIYNETGIQFMPINTLYHLAAEARQDAPGHAAAERFLMIGDWIHYLLSGQSLQEESNASSTQAWNPRTRSWSTSLAEAAGIRPGLFPKVVPPCTSLGHLLAPIREETGLEPMQVVAGCVHDTGAAVAAVPAEPGEDWAYLSSGTWSLIGVELPAPLINDAARLANFTNETGVGGTSRFLRNASGLWILQECKRQWAREGKDWTYDELTTEAESAEPFRSLVNPDDPRFLRPANMPEAVQAYCRETSQPIPETPGQFARCVFESLALLYGKMLTLLETVTGRALQKLHIVGGGSKNALLNQMTADATGRTVIAGPVEATAIGNLLLQALTLGHLPDHESLRKVVRDSFKVKHHPPADSEDWLSAQARFEALP